MSSEHPRRVGRTHDVFLSYSKKDARRAKMLAAALQRAGLSVWWDRDIPPGMTWAQVIERAIDASTMVVVVWTPASVKSEWVHKEARKGEQKGALVPVLAAEAPVPFEFEHVQAANLIGWDGHSLTDGFQSLLQSIEELANRKLDRDRLAEAWTRTRRRRRMIVGALAAAWLLVAAILVFMPVRTARLDLVGMELTGLRIDLDTVGTTEMGEVPVDFLAISGDRALDTVRVSPQSLERVTTLVDVPDVVMTPAAGDGAASLRLTGFRYPPGAVLEIQRPFDDYTLRSPPTDEWLLTAAGTWRLTAGDMEDVFDFGQGGSVVVRTDQIVFFDFRAASSPDDIVLFEDAGITDVELSYFDRFDTAGAQSTVRGGTLEARWAGGLAPLHEGSALGFDSFRGQLGRLWLEEGGLRANLQGDEVTGVRLDGGEIMPSFFEAQRPVTQGALLFGLLVGLVGVGGLAWHWQSPW